MRMKHILRQVEPDRDKLRHDRSPLWFLADPPWYIDAVAGGHSIRVTASVKNVLHCVHYSIEIESYSILSVKL